MKFLSIDPGTKSGYVVRSTIDSEIDIGEWNNAAKRETKKKQAEPKYFRLLHLWNNVNNKCIENEIQLIVCEGAAGFMRGKAAVEASHKFRAVIQLYCALHNIQYIEISPIDLKFYATGKRTASKDEMIRAAKLNGYVGHNDNEADAYLISLWQLEQLIDKHKEHYYDNQGV